jgi:small subunit ribosomal protein S4
MKKALEKRERSLGVKLSIKGDRCNSPKCALIRKPYAPGVHGKSGFKRPSEFRSQLQEKQKIRFSYGLTNKQLASLFDWAESKPRVTSELVIESLESRLDNVVYRLGFAESRPNARQLVSHGHFMVNGKKARTPSIRVRPNDKITIRPISKDNPQFKNLSEKLKGYELPSWLSLNKETLEGIVLSDPKDIKMLFDINLVVDYYSR